MQTFQMLALAIEHTHVRAEEFVSRAHQEIAIQRSDINRPVRCIVDSINVCQGATVVGKLHDFFDWIDRAHGV